MKPKAGSSTENGPGGPSSARRSPSVLWAFSSDALANRQKRKVNSADESYGQSRPSELLMRSRNLPWRPWGEGTPEENPPKRVKPNDETPTNLSTSIELKSALNGSNDETIGARPRSLEYFSFNAITSSSPVNTARKSRRHYLISSPDKLSALRKIASSISNERSNSHFNLVVLGNSIDVQQHLEHFESQNVDCCKFDARSIFFNENSLNVTDVSVLSANGGFEPFWKIVKYANDKHLTLRLIFGEADRAAFESMSFDRTWRNFAEMTKRIQVELDLVALTTAMYKDVNSAIAEKLFASNDYQWYEGFSSVANKSIRVVDKDGHFVKLVELIMTDYLASQKFVIVSPDKDDTERFTETLREKLGCSAQIVDSRPMNATEVARTISNFVRNSKGKFIVINDINLLLQQPETSFMCKIIFARISQNISDFIQALSISRDEILVCHGSNDYEKVKKFVKLSDKFKLIEFKSIERKNRGLDLSKTMLDDIFMSRKTSAQALHEILRAELEIRR